MRDADKGGSYVPRAGPEPGEQSYLTRIISHPRMNRILDSGSLDGSYFAGVVPFRDNVYIGDIHPDLLESGKQKYGFNTLLLDETGTIPVPDGFFDIVWCFGRDRARYG